jgi:Protein of unknown function (DUF4239)
VHFRCDAARRLSLNCFADASSEHGDEGDCQAQHGRHWHDGRTCAWPADCVGKTSFDAKANQIKQLTVSIIVIDQLFAQYGTETYPLRELLRGGVAARADKIWSERDLATATKTAFAMSAEAEGFLRRVEALDPQTESQRALKARIITAITDLAQTRLLLYAQAENTIPLPFLVLLIFWLAIIFGSFSLFVAPNPVVIASFLVCAISASGALFLIFELVTPFSGLMPISDAPLRHALAPL